MTADEMTSRTWSATKAFALILMLSLPLAAEQPTGKGTSAAPEPTGFASVNWGDSMAAIKAAFPTAKCSGDKKPREDGTLHQSCEVRSFKIGKVDTSPTFYLRDDKVTEIRAAFSSYGYDEMKSLLYEKYGSDAIVETTTERESAFSHAMTGRRGSRPEVWHITRSTWKWTDTEAELQDNREFGPYSATSVFTLKRLTAEEKAARQKALSSF